MDQSELKDLVKEAIAYWERISLNEEDCKGPDGCVLCMAFYNNSMNGYECEGCPIQSYTGQSFCKMSPLSEFEDYMEHQADFLRKLQDSSIYKWFVFDKKSKDLADAEVEFLKTVLESL